MNSHEDTVSTIDQLCLFEVRCQTVVLDGDLASIYGVPTKHFNRSVGRNADRFPADLALQLVDEEFENLTRDTAHPDGHRPDYQRRLACDPECKSRLIDIPTASGKTAAVMLAWLWNRVINPQSPICNPQSDWPCRLVYCLPTRALVEQTKCSLGLLTEHGPFRLAYYEM